MSRVFFSFILCACLATVAHAAAKPHNVAFGKWQTVKWYVGSADNQAINLRIRPLFVDGKLKEYTTGTAHEVTERLFVVRRVFRLNDALPDESTAAPRWTWEQGGWLLVDRSTGRVSAVNLPEFDSFSSVVSWYRDYAAYCGVSDDGKKIEAVVVQLGKRKPALKKLVGNRTGDDVPDSACPAPLWQRQPARVTFTPQGSQKMMFSVRQRVFDIVNEDGDGDDAAE